MSRRKRILVVDDERDLADLIVMNLHRNGYDAQTAYDGPTGLDLARKLHLDQSYIARTIRLASLAPNIIEAILTNQAPDGLSLWTLRHDLPLLWQEQRKQLGMEVN